jgi:hypothetical protein
MRGPGAAPKEDRVMLRCRGRRILTNKSQSEPHDAVVTDETGTVLAGPFRNVADAVAWIQARSPSRPL